MSNDPARAVSLRDLVIDVADRPGLQNRSAAIASLVVATVFLKVVAGQELRAQRPGAKYDVRDGTGVRSVRLPNGMLMVLVSAVPPRVVAPDEVVVTMAGREALAMALKIPDTGLIVTAEDDRDSWIAIPQGEIAGILSKA